MTYKNLEIVALNHYISEYGLKEGDTGTIVEVYDNGSAFEVEFINPQGETIALLTLNPSDIRSLKHNPVSIWREPAWEKPAIYPSITSTSYHAGTAQVDYPQL
ncbi:MAG: DUF4926 domain-containing protein [Candidatus Daviesbacteria bacterium]|nr:DUF4926 domain-containing protein [Candidatus Daviesbacteria bacterium]